MKHLYEVEVKTRLTLVFEGDEPPTQQMMRIRIHQNLDVSRFQDYKVIQEVHGENPTF